MTSCSVLFPQARKLDVDIARCLEELATPSMPRPGQLQQTGQSPEEAERTATQKLRELDALISTLLARVAYEPAAKRELWRTRVQELQQQTTSQRAELEKHSMQRFARSKEREEREALLSSTRVDHHAAAVNLYAAESDAIGRSRQMVGEYVGIARATMSSLGTQGSSLKSAHSKLLDIGNVLGLSNSLLRVIGQRQSGDKWLVYGGMLLTMLLLGYVAGWVSLGTALWAILVFGAAAAFAVHNEG